MNVILLFNGFLLLSILGFQQWCGTYARLENFLPWEGAGLAFANISLFIPLSVFVMSKFEKVSRKKEIIALLIFNPLMFSIIPFRCQQINYQWSIAKIAGPQRIQTFKTDEPVFAGSLL